MVLALAKNDPSPLESAEELQQFCEHYNWDNGVLPLQAVVSHPQCDHGTALFLYWMSEPNYAHERYASLEDARAAKDVNITEMAFAEDLALRLDASEFSTGKVGFAPTALPSNGVCWPFLPVVLRPSPGPTRTQELLMDVGFRDLTKEEQAALAKKFVAAVSALKKVGVSVAVDGEPRVIVDALHAFSLTLPTLKPPPSKVALRAMGVLFGDQVHRACGAPWKLRYAGATSDFFVCSKDRAVTLWAQRCVEPLCDASMHKFYDLRGLFDAFVKVVNDGEHFQQILSPDESRNLYRDSQHPQAWPVWGVNYKLHPWP